MGSDFSPNRYYKAKINGNLDDLKYELLPLLKVLELLLK